MFRNALIDFDGTICHTKQAISACLRETLKGRDIEQCRIDQLINSGIDLNRTLQELTGEHGKEIEKLVATYRDLYNSEFGLTYSCLFDGVGEFFQILHQRSVPILVVSNKGVLAIQKALHHFNLDRFVTGIVADTGDGGPKHDSELCVRQVRKIIPDCSLESLILIGDTPLDITFARSIGICVGCVREGYGDLAAILREKPDYLENKLIDFAKYFVTIQVGFISGDY